MDLLEKLYKLIHRPCTQIWGVKCGVLVRLVFELKLEIFLVLEQFLY
jgi:hypothetical protein